MNDHENPWVKERENPQSVGVYPKAETFGAAPLSLPTDYLFTAPIQEVCQGLAQKPPAHTAPANAAYLLSGPRNVV